MTGLFDFAPDPSIRPEPRRSRWRRVERATRVARYAAQARRGDTVMVSYTGWRQRTGETFFTTKGIGQPLSLDVDHAAPAFREALQLLHKGEKAVLWVPPSESAPEPLVYEIEVTEVTSPPQVAKPATASDGSQRTTKSGL